MGNYITPADFLMGVRYWVAWYHMGVPAYDVFKYIGHDKTDGHFVFKSVRNQALITRSYHQLNRNGFYPFVLDHTRITSYLNSQGGEPNANL